jgi:hypothetical protein
MAVSFLYRAIQTIRQGPLLREGSVIMIRIISGNAGAVKP